jgi:uncharacterized protein (UPF0335 family)
MFINFADEEKSRLNKGVRGRLVDHVKTLMDKRKMKGFDVKYIYDQTMEMKNEDEDDKRAHEINFLSRIYLEKIKYFN